MASKTRPKSDTKQKRTKSKLKDHPAGRWPKIFNKKRRVIDPRFFELQDALSEVEKDVVDAAFETWGPSWEMAVVRSFFKAEQLSCSTYSTSARARLDDRDYDIENARTGKPLASCLPYDEWLDAAELHQALSSEVCTLRNIVDY